MNVMMINIPKMIFSILISLNLLASFSFSSIRAETSPSTSHHHQTDADHHSGIHSDDYAPHHSIHDLELSHHELHDSDGMDSMLESSAAGFSCDNRMDGVYPDVESECKKFFVCEKHQVYSLSCPSSTRFYPRFESCSYVPPEELSSFECNMSPDSPQALARIQSLHHAPSYHDDPDVHEIERRSEAGGNRVMAGNRFRNQQEERVKYRTIELDDPRDLEFIQILLKEHLRMQQLNRQKQQSKSRRQIKPVNKQQSQSSQPVVNRKRQEQMEVQQTRESPQIMLPSPSVSASSSSPVHISRTSNEWTPILPDSKPSASTLVAVTHKNLSPCQAAMRRRFTRDTVREYIRCMNA